MSDWFDAEGHADRAFEMYERGRWAEAESELRKALSLNPGQAEWHYNLGLTLEAAGRDQEALSSYERAIELIPDQAEPIVAAGIVAARLELYERAIKLFDHALQLDPRNESAYASRIEAQCALGDHDEAETTFYLAQQSLPEPSAACMAAIAESLIEREEYARAGWCLREALRIDPSTPRVMARLGAVYAALGRPQRAVQLFLRDLRDDPGNIDTLLEYGDLLVDLGRMPEAAEKFRRVLELEPANIDAHMRLGELAMRGSSYEHARLEFELVLRLDPAYEQGRVALGEALLREGRCDEARQRLKDEHQQGTWAGEMKPSPGDEDRDDSAEPWSAADLGRFASLLLEADLPSEASAVYALAVRAPELTRRKKVDLLRQLALARFRSGDREGGVAASRRVLRLDPRCIPSMHNLALAAIEDGRLDFAAGWIARGLKINRHDDGLRRLRTRLWLARLRGLMRRG
jgi:tetratricopeptide (TPR) repeat protein